MVTNLLTAEVANHAVELMMDPFGCGDAGKIVTGTCWPKGGGPIKCSIIFPI